MVVLWLGLYLVLTTNWPLWNELARIGGAPSTYLPTIAAMSLLTLCGTVAMLSFTAWSRWMKPLWFAGGRAGRGGAALHAGVPRRHGPDHDRQRHADRPQRGARPAELAHGLQRAGGRTARGLAALARAHRADGFLSKLWRNAALLVLAVVVALAAAWR
jgi:lipid A ethanolaminephosphotransferase